MVAPSVKSEMRWAQSGRSDRSDCKFNRVAYS